MKIFCHRLSGALKLQVIANKQTICYPTSLLPEINDTLVERTREGLGEVSYRHLIDWEKIYGNATNPVVHARYSKTDLREACRRRKIISVAQLAEIQC
jgi:hypothetical protein